MTTQFEKDYNNIKLLGIKGDATIIMKERKMELEDLIKQMKLARKNPFRLNCICQEYERRKEEYEILNELI